MMADFIQRRILHSRSHLNHIYLDRSNKSLFNSSALQALWPAIILGGKVKFMRQLHLKEFVKIVTSGEGRIVGDLTEEKASR